MGDITVLGPVLVRLGKPEVAWSDWTSSPLVELPAFRVGGHDYVFHAGRRIEKGRVRRNLGPDDDEDAILRKRGGEIIDTYRVFRLGDPAEPGGPRPAFPMFRMPLPRPGSGRTVPPFLQAMAFLIEMPPAERTGYIDVDYATSVIEVKPGITITSSDPESAYAAARELGYAPVAPPTPGAVTVLPATASGRKRRSLFRR